MKRLFKTPFLAALTYYSVDFDLELRIEYSVTLGTEPSGQYGPPEHYDPGSPDELEIASIRLMEGKKERALPEWMETRIVDHLRDGLIAEWKEDEAAAYDDAMGHRADMRREDDALTFHRSAA